MAYEIPGQMVTLAASTNILSTTSANYQFRFVTVSTAGEATVPSAAGAPIFGITQNKVTAGGEAVTVMINGISKLWSEGNVGEGGTISASSVGFASTVAAAHYTVGRVLTASSGSTGLITVHITPIGTT